MDLAAQTFAQFDTNNNGLLDERQVQQCLGTITRLERAFSARTVQFFMTKFGGVINNVLCVDLPAFRTMMVYIENTHNTFSQFDTNRCGSLNLQDLFRVFQSSHMVTDAATIQRLGAKYDADNSGVLEFDEFCQFLVEWDLYKKIFDEADLDRNAHISLDELQGVMCRLNNEFAAVFSNQWGNQRPFSRLTCIALLHKFSGYGDEVQHSPDRSPGRSTRHFELGFAHFGEMLTYLIELKNRFAELDSRQNGQLCARDVFLALQKFQSAGRMACNATEDLTLRVMRLYDTDNNGYIEFDEFCQFVIEWEEYLDRYRRHATDFGVNSFGLQLILGDLPDISSMAVRNADGSKPAQGYLFEGRNLMRDFDLKTCSTLVSKFGTGNQNTGFLNVTQYMEMIHYLKNMKIEFNQNDILVNGKLSYAEIQRGFALSGLNLSDTAFKNIIRSYNVADSTNSFSLNFDAFVQLRLELEVVTTLFSAVADGNGVTHLNFEQMLDFIFRLPRGDQNGFPGSGFPA